MGCASSKHQDQAGMRHHRAKGGRPGPPEQRRGAAKGGQEGFTGASGPHKKPGSKGDLTQAGGGGHGRTPFKGEVGGLHSRPGDAKSQPQPHSQTGMPRGKTGEARKKVHDSDDGSRGAGIRGTRKGATESRAEADEQEGEDGVAGGFSERDKGGRPGTPGSSGAPGTKGRLRKVGGDGEETASDSEATLGRQKNRHDGAVDEEGGRRRAGGGGHEELKGRSGKGGMGVGFGMGSGLAATLGMGPAARRGQGKGVSDTSMGGGHAINPARSAGFKASGRASKALRSSSLQDRARKADGDAEKASVQAVAGEGSSSAASTSGGEASSGKDKGALSLAEQRRARAKSGSLLGPGMKKKHKQAREEREREEKKHKQAREEREREEKKDRDGDGNAERDKDRESRRSPRSAGVGAVRSVSTTSSTSTGAGGGRGLGSMGLSGGKVGMAPIVLGHVAKEKALTASGRDESTGKNLFAKDSDSAWLYEPLIRCSTFLGTQGKIEVMGFEVANTVVRSIRLRQQLQQRDLEALRKDVIQSEGIQTLVSSDEDYVWFLAGSDKREELRAIARDVVRMGRMATKPELHHLAAKLNSLGKDKDRHWKNVATEQADKVFKRLESRARATADLYHEISSLENMQKALSKRLKEPKSAIQDIVSHMKTELKNQEKKVQEKRAEGLWDQSMDRVVPDLFVVAVVLHFRIVEAFGERVLDDGPLVSQTLEDTMYARENDTSPWPSTPGTTTPRQFPLSPVANIPGAAASSAATVLSFPSSSSAPSFPSASSHAGPAAADQTANPASLSYGSLSFGHASRPPSGLATSAGSMSLRASYPHSGPGTSVLGAASAPATATPGAGGTPWPKSRSVTGGASEKELTLGETGMSLHYANIVAMVDKMVLRANMFQHRDALYTALPRAVKQRLKRDLQSSSDLELVPTEEIKQRLAQRLDWLATMAENTIKVGVDKRLQGHTDLTLLETLHHAKEGKMQALLTELLVNLQHLVARSMMQQEEDDGDDDDFDFGDDELLLLSLQQQEQKQPPADWKPVPQFAIVAPMPDMDQPSRASAAADQPGSQGSADDPTAAPHPTDAPTPIPHPTDAPIPAASNSAPRPSSPATDPSIASAPRSFGSRGSLPAQSLSRSTSSSSSGPLASGLPEAEQGEAAGTAASGGGLVSLVAAGGAAAGAAAAARGEGAETEGEPSVLLPVEKAASFPLGQSDVGKGAGAGMEGGTPGPPGGPGLGPNIAKRILYSSGSGAHGSPNYLPLVPEDGDVLQDDGSPIIPASAPVLGPLSAQHQHQQQQMQRRRKHGRVMAARSGPLRPREGMWLQGSGPVGGGGGNWRGDTFSVHGGGSGGLYVSALRGVHSLDFNFPRANTERAGHSMGGGFAEGEEDGGEGLRGAQRRMMMSGGGFAAWSEVSAEIREEFEERIRDSALSRRPSRIRTLSRTVKQMNSRQVDLDSGRLTVNTRAAARPSQVTGAEAESSEGAGAGQPAEGVGETRSEDEGAEGEGAPEERRGPAGGPEDLTLPGSGDMFQDNDDDSLDIPAMTPRSLDVDRIGDEYFDELTHGGGSFH